MKVSQYRGCLALGRVGSPSRSTQGRSSCRLPSTPPFVARASSPALTSSSLKHHLEPSTTGHAMLYTSYATPTPASSSEEKSLVVPIFPPLSTASPGPVVSGSATSLATDRPTRQGGQKSRGQAWGKGRGREGKSGAKDGWVPYLAGAGADRAAGGDEREEDRDRDCRAMAAS